MCAEVVGVLKDLKALRDMTIAEVRLTISVEDPRARELRLMGMEDKSGVSRDEMAAALNEVAEGRVPTDRIALRELHREMISWPFLRQDTEAGEEKGWGLLGAEARAGLRGVRQGAPLAFSGARERERVSHARVRPSPVKVADRRPARLRLRPQPCRAGARGRPHLAGRGGQPAGQPAPAADGARQVGGAAVHHRHAARLGGVRRPLRRQHPPRPHRHRRHGDPVPKQPALRIGMRVL